MPTVTVEMTINAPASDTWRAVTDLAEYPKFMTNVQSVVVHETGTAGARLSDWSVILKGSLLEWTEEDRTDDETRIMTFHQVEGDLERFVGDWRVLEIDAATSTVRVTIDFEIGIPLLADMLDPVAGRALEENCRQMLEAIDTRVART
ncbi:type II toxin-antitoxin system RatA family toxin [Streptomyces johnsoniae]|uniref:SRPBCC family protein n=1 Tax=Streptomyces johnsoniae TaxID=3075532 RepID=A0ABU2S4P6_9ACTN|nr:SRPBCC family protein [Streptomyces sp. DSM 41886]MDT0443778.1 SRPBCC family protein [Streptomyces sp. DSM 41886]